MNFETAKEPLRSEGATKPGRGRSFLARIPGFRRHPPQPEEEEAEEEDWATDETDTSLLFSGDVCEVDAAVVRAVVLGAWGGDERIYDRLAQKVDPGGEQVSVVGFKVLLVVHRLMQVGPPRREAAEEVVRAVQRQAADICADANASPSFDAEDETAQFCGTYGKWLLERAAVQQQYEIFFTGNWSVDDFFESNGLSFDNLPICNLPAPFSPASVGVCQRLVALATGLIDVLRVMISASDSPHGPLFLSTVPPLAEDLEAIFGISSHLITRLLAVSPPARKERHILQGPYTNLLQNYLLVAAEAQSLASVHPLLTTVSAPEDALFKLFPHSSYTTMGAVELADALHRTPVPSAVDLNWISSARPDRLLRVWRPLVLGPPPPTRSESSDGSPSGRPALTPQARRGAVDDFEEELSSLWGCKSSPVPAPSTARDKKRVKKKKSRDRRSQPEDQFESNLWAVAPVSRPQAPQAAQPAPQAPQAEVAPFGHWAAPVYHPPAPVLPFRGPENAAQNFRGVELPVQAPAAEDWEVVPEEVVLEAQVGAGATSEVYRGIWRGTEIAVKKLISAGWERAAEVQFRRELSILLRLRHPHLVLFMGACVRTRPLFLVTEYCEGGTLFEMLHGNVERGVPPLRMTMAQKVKVALDIAKGCTYLHACTPPVVHRDLKSLNILLATPVRHTDDVPHAKVADFGLSRLRKSWLDDNRHGMVGTRQWMAPEVLEGRPHSEAVDVFSFGIILFEIISQRIPYDDWPPAVPLAEAVIHGARPSISLVPTCTPPALRRLMEACWAGSPEKRPEFTGILRGLRGIDQQSRGFCE